MSREIEYGESSFRCVPRLSEAMAELMRPAQISLHRTKSASWHGHGRPSRHWPQPWPPGGADLARQPTPLSYSGSQSVSKSHPLASLLPNGNAPSSLLFFLFYFIIIFFFFCLPSFSVIHKRDPSCWLYFSLFFFFSFSSSTSPFVAGAFLLLLLPTERDGYYPSFIPWKKG